MRSTGEKLVTVNYIEERIHLRLRILRCDGEAINTFQVHLLLQT